MYDMKELALLAAALTMRNVPFTFKKCNDGWSIVGDNWDVALNCLTMGAREGLLELLVWERWRDPEGAIGYLTASETIERLQKIGLIPQD